MKITLLPVAFGLLLAVNVQAKDRADQCGAYTSVDTGEQTVDMGNNTRFMNFRSSTQMQSAEGSKFNELSGQCTGGAVIYPDGSVEAEGLCAVTDVSGDVLTYAFTQGRGAREGKYTRKGGTGKFANSRETGWFQAVSLNGDVTTGNWGGKGACK
jgi:hypothetical protein